MTADTPPTLIDRLAEKVEASGALTMIEDRRFLVRVILAIPVAVAALSVTGAMLFFRYDEAVAGWTLIGLAASYIPILGLFVATGSIHLTAMCALASATAAQLTIHIVLGGYANSGGIMLWAIQGAVVCAVVLRWLWARLYLAGSVALGVALLFVEARLRAGRDAPDPDLVAQSLVFLLIGTLVTVIPMLRFLLNRLGMERARAEGLLLNVLPAEVAAELKEHGSVTARRYEAISVLFADIVGFTPMSAELEPEEMVGRLNTVFSHFDALGDEFGCEKIRTIGDNYMVAAGIPERRDDHAHTLAEMALRMQEFATETPFRFRIGIESGPAVAGVIGTRKFQYDVWGDTVNTASRMESQGEPGRIQIGEETHRLIAGDFVCTPRGDVEIKGKGSMRTWFLEGPRIDS